jgi:hypothetical protein
MAAYGLLGVEPEPPTPREQGRFARGRDAGHYFARQMKAKHGEENVVEEAAVPWPAPPELPIGELHVDVIVKSERLGIEAKNTKWVDSLFDSAVLQIAGGVHFSPDLDTGLVVFLDHEYQVTDEFPVFLTDELVEQVESIAAQVVEAGKTGTLPERVCEKPSDARSHLCPFAEHCFSDWAAPPAEEREDLSELASEAYLIQRELKAVKGAAGDLQQRWEEMKGRLLAVDLLPGETMAGPIRIRRTDRKSSRRFSLSKAEKAGVWGPIHEETLGSFVSFSEGSTTFDLQKTEAEAPLDLDYGDVPF